MTSSIVVTPQKALPCAETRRLSHKAWKSVRRFDLGAGSRKMERTGQDRKVKKVTKALYFTYLGRSPNWTDFHKNLHSSCRPRRNHVCKRLSWNFQGSRFYRGSNFPFSYWFFHGPYNSAALLRCLWYAKFMRVISRWPTFSKGCRKIPRDDGPQFGTVL